MHEVVHLVVLWVSLRWRILRSHTARQEVEDCCLLSRHGGFCLADVQPHADVGHPQREEDAVGIRDLVPTPTHSVLQHRDGNCGIPWRCVLGHDRRQDIQEVPLLVGSVRERPTTELLGDVCLEHTPGAQEERDLRVDEQHCAHATRAQHGPGERELQHVGLIQLCRAVLVVGEGVAPVRHGVCAMPMPRAGVELKHSHREGEGGAPPVRDHPHRGLPARRHCLHK
mmetsp:Transcript_6630/g.14399  ORF Transcript_6630/g.14399 Transcript_6630/m.14399 type:complete len:226 (-) Transcript_6630:63-740(-)